MEFDEFLQEGAPLLGLQWRPFRRKGIKRKIEHRIEEVGLQGFEPYLEKVKREPEEQRFLSKILTITISRFFRDKEVFDSLARSVFPALLKDESREDLRVWSIGCASGEEPYSLVMLWKEKFESSWPRARLFVLATDTDEDLLKRARERRYKRSSLREVPQETLKRFFREEDEAYLLDEAVCEKTELRQHDVLREEPFSDMDLILCRNLVFTYFSKERQIEVLKKISLSLKEGGYLVIGKDESLPLVYPTLFVAAFPKEKIYEKFS